MRIAVARELAPGEARVALIPDLVGKLRAAGYEVAVQAGAGAAVLLTDAAYEAAGALVTEHPFDEAHLVLSVQPLDAQCLAPLPSGAATISFFPLAGRPGDIALRRDRKITTFGMEYVPRISRAQSMDALSSQAMVAGYRGARGRQRTSACAGVTCSPRPWPSPQDSVSGADLPARRVRDNLLLISSVGTAGSQCRRLEDVHARQRWWLA